MNKIKELYLFLSDIIKNRKLLFSLAKNDFKTKFAGSFFGIIWAFIQPLTTILVFWVVIGTGLRQTPGGDLPFVLYFVAGFVPYNLFSDVLGGASGCLHEYSYLVKKIRFRTSVLPLVKIVSALFVHAFFVALIFVIYAIYGRPFDIYYLQCFYYSFALVCMCVGLAWLTSALSVFFKDMSQLVGVVLQVGFWMTPIFWSPADMALNSPKLLAVLKLNPLYYIATGYRDCFIDHIGFWHRQNLGLYFWIITFVLFILGAITYRRLRPHFADVL